MINSRSKSRRKSISSSERKLWNSGLQQEINDSIVTDGGSSTVLLFRRCIDAVVGKLHANQLLHD